MKDPTPLYQLLNTDPRAREYYDNLHLSVRAYLEEYSEDILSCEDLIRISNEQMNEALREVSGIYEDSDPDPDPI